MDFQFVIPLTPEGLLKSGESTSRYAVNGYTEVNKLSEKELHKKLDGRIPSLGNLLIIIYIFLLLSCVFKD